ncbi:MAG: DUF1232 domain-containing protein [Zhenhengia sp.]
MYDHHENKLGMLIRECVREKDWSMRRLSQYVQMDQATLSRIVNGKQKAGLVHMQRLAQALDLPMHTLIEAAGFQINLEEQEISKVSRSGEQPDLIDYIFKFYELEKDPLLIDKIKAELIKYEPYALTHEGENLIDRRLGDKIEALSAEGPLIERMEVLYKHFKEEALSKEEKQIIGSGLLYFVISTDIIPDYIFPIGYLDDVIAIRLVEEKLAKL